MSNFVAGATHQTDQSLLGQQTQALNGHLNSLTQNGETIKSELVRLESVWAGNAALAFQEAANTWMSGYQQVMQALNGLVRNLNSANEEFASAESNRTSQTTNSWR